MIDFTFNCFENFSCLKGKCKNSCCEKWKIKIDKKTLRRYYKVKGEFGKKLKDNIDKKNRAFINLDNGRCPFLNEDNLCDIIIKLGYKKLSNVCDLHPRFKTYFSFGTETGFGVSCEKACQMLLEHNDDIKLLAKGSSLFSPTKKERVALNFRKEILSIIYDKNFDLNQKINMILDNCKIDLYKKDVKYWQKLLLSLEHLDNNWYEKLQDLTAFQPIINDEYNLQYKNILSYFVFRHSLKSFDLTDIYINTAFAVFSFLVIYNIFINSKEKSLSVLSEILRCYSQEIEYSENNLDTIFGELELLIRLI